MAQWLCRLEADGLEAVGRDDAHAMQLGISAWVLPIPLSRGLDAASAQLIPLLKAAGALPVVVELLLSQSIPAGDERAWIGLMSELLTSPRALQQEEPSP